MTKKVYLTIGIGPSKEKLGDLEIELYDEEVPKTVANFCHHLKKNYRGCQFHRIIRNFMVQCGDYIKGDGTGGDSLYGPTFADENLHHSHLHSQRGVLSMANSGPDTNGSQFFITFRPTPHLDGKHVVFGQVVAGDNVLQALEKISTDSGDHPKVPVVIIDCGIREENTQQETESGKKSLEVHSNDDECEIDLDDDVKSPRETENEEIGGRKEQQQSDDIHDETTNTSLKNPLKDRLRRLKMKMNQARQLNRKEVMAEGERLSHDGSKKEMERLRLKDKKRCEVEWERQNAKALQMAAANGILGKNGKSLVEPAHDSMQKARKQKDTEIRNRYSVYDYYNPEGQHRHYERNLKSLPNHILNREETEIYNPISAVLSDSSTKQKEQEGAQRIAKEMRRRIEKQKNSKRNRMEFEGEDVSYINKRNQMFNKKINRNYDKATAEIRQNLERGTAL